MNSILAPIALLLFALSPVLIEALSSNLWMIGFVRLLCAIGFGLIFYRDSWNFFKSWKTIIRRTCN